MDSENDIDIFANIDSYLNDIDNVENVSHHMAEQSVLASDFASDSTPERSITAGRHKTQKRGPKAANVSNVPMDDTIDDDSDDDAACGATLRDMTPGKGQKLAYQRYRKLKDKLKTHVSRPVSLPMAPVFRSSETTEPTPKEFRVPTWDELDGGCPAASAASAASTARITRSCAASASAIIDLSNGDDGSNYDILSRGPTDDGPQLFGGTSSAPVAPPASRSSLQQLFDDENYTMQVKVKWCSAPIETLPLRRHQPFVDLCKVFAGRLADAAPEHIVLMLNERILRHDETPDAVDLTIGKVITARHMKPEDIQTLHRTTHTSISNSTKTSDSSITLKIQSSLWKKPIQLAVEPNKRLIVLVIHCAQQLNCEPDRLRLRFDGEALDLQQTAADLDLEGGEMLDLWMVD